MFKVTERRKITHQKKCSQETRVWQNMKNHSLQETIDHVKRTVACLSVANSDTGRQKKGERSYGKLKSIPE